MDNKTLYSDEQVITDNELSFEVRGFMVYFKQKVLEYISKSDIAESQQELIDEAVVKVLAELSEEQIEVAKRSLDELQKNGYYLGAE